MTEKILIVDDEPDMLRLMGMIIKDKTAYESTTTNNPFEALEMAKTGQYDLIISDMKMPELGGLELLKLMRQADIDVPVIMITAYSTTEAAQEALDDNAFDFISKPFKKEKIIFSIEKAIRFSRLQKENKRLKEIAGEGR
jgi:DNA-binding NtrC family response regulator